MVQKSALAASEIGSGMLVQQAGRSPRLEMVSFKKLSKGTLALGVVFKVMAALPLDTNCAIDSS